MFRREWRQQFLVLALLTAAVAASIGLGSAAYTAAPVPDTAEFGAASHVIRFGGTEPMVMDADVAAARQWFDGADVIHHRQVPAPGLFEPVDYRTQDPAGPLGGPRLALLEGMYPAGGQVAITDGIADVLRLGIGASLSLDGVSRTVVGVVENPGNLGDEFVLVAPSETADADEVTILVTSSDDHAQTFRIPSGAGITIGSRQANSDVMAAVGVLVLETVGMLFIALIAGASFIVIAHRRMRQLGMLAAIGASVKQLRLVTIANGMVIGVVAAMFGAIIGLAGWVVVAPMVEDALGYRVNELDVPLWMVAAGMLLAVVAATAAAWWPARSVARVPAVRALSGRPPEPRPARRTAVPAAVFAVAGLTCLAIGGNLIDGKGIDATNAVLFVAGTVAVALAVLFACPLAIRLLAGSVGRLPVAVRLAIGDLARYRARSSAALAAISLALGIAVTNIVLATAAHASADEGNLAENQVLIRAFNGPMIPEAADVDRLQRAVDRVVTAFSDPGVTALHAAVDPASTPDPSFNGREAISLGARTGDGWNDISLLYIATPRLLAYYGHDLGSGAPGAGVFTREIGDFTLGGDTRADRARVETVTNVALLRPSYRSLPGTFVTTDVVAERGWVSAPSGRWLVETSAPATTEQVAAARELAAGADLTIEVRDRQGGLGALRSGATAGGMLAALGVVAMTVGLVRGEAGRDLRILTATGATRRTRRTLTAATAGGLAILGVILGTVGAYLGLTAGFAQDMSALYPVPVAHLAVIAVGLPLVAVVVGWLVAGRTATGIARPMQ